MEHLYSAFVQTAKGCHAWYQPAFKEQPGVQYLAQGQFNMVNGGGGNQTIINIIINIISFF